jgi:hypothetical protein
MEEVNYMSKHRGADTIEDGYKREVERYRHIFDKIIGCKILKITIPKDSCGHADDAFTFHVIDEHHKVKFVKIGSSEWISMTVIEDG